MYRHIFRYSVGVITEHASRGDSLDEVQAILSYICPYIYLSLDSHMQI